MQWVKIGEGDFINASHISRVKYDKNAKAYKVTLSNRENIIADEFIPVNTYEINEEKEN